MYFYGLKTRCIVNSELCMCCLGCVTRTLGFEENKISDFTSEYTLLHLLLTKQLTSLKQMFFNVCKKKVLQTTILTVQG